MVIDFDLFDAVLLDLDGTIYHEEHALPGAVSLVQRLKAEGRKYACLTNSTSSPQRVSERLMRMEIAIDADHVYTAAAATADYVLQRFGRATLEGLAVQPAAGGAKPRPPESSADAHRRPRVFNLSTEGVAEMLEGRVQWVDTEEEACDAVICGVPLNFFATEARQRIAMLLLRKGAELVAICADRVYPSPRGLEFGVGAMAAMLSYAAMKRPIFCGKPENVFFNELCHRLEVRPDRCVLVGDNLESDIAGAKGVGMKTILTLTGVATRQDALHLPPSEQPDWIVEDLSEL